jgi:hypothetical protein
LWFESYYMTRSARDKYQAELAAMRGDPIPQIRAVLEKLRGFAARVTEARRATFLAETTTCLAASAYRATIVMGWNLAYYHLRDWILAKHLTAFNHELTSRKRSATKYYDPVTSHDDFPDSESLVLDVSAAAGIVDKHRRDILEVALKRRNRFAHPGPAVATELEAAAFVADLLENVIASTYFS